MPVHRVARRWRPSSDTAATSGTWPPSFMRTAGAGAFLHASLRVGLGLRAGKRACLQRLAACGNGAAGSRCDVCCRSCRQTTGSIVYRVT